MALVGALTQSLPVPIGPEPCPVVGLTAEALCLCGKVLGLIRGNAALMDLDGYSFFKDLDVRDEGWVCCSGSADALPSHSSLRSGSLFARELGPARLTIAEPISTKWPRKVVQPTGIAGFIRKIAGKWRTGDATEL